MHGHVLFRPERAGVLEDEGRLDMQIGEATLTDLLALKGTEDVADLGSGTGFYTDRVAQLTRGIVYAVELQPEIAAIHLAKGLPKNVRQVLADINQLPLPPGSIDVAYSIITFHETHGFSGMRKLYEALRPGGRVVIVDWRRDPADGAEGPPLEVRYTKEEVAVVLRPFFETKRAENVGRYLFAVAAERRQHELP
jgi:SAM-dependent methyltransferase